MSTRRTRINTKSRIINQMPERGALRSRGARHSVLVPPLKMGLFTSSVAIGDAST